MKLIHFIVQIPVPETATDADITDAAGDIGVALEDFGFKGAKVLGIAAMRQDAGGGDGEIADKARVS